MVLNTLSVYGMQKVTALSPETSTFKNSLGSGCSLVEYLCQKSREIDGSVLV